MSTINLRDQVQKALNVEWAGFAQRHPRLAEALDQPLLVEQAVADLSVDAEFQAAMSQAAGAGVMAQTLDDLIGRYVRQFLAELLGG